MSEAKQSGGVACGSSPLLSGVCCGERHITKFCPHCGNPIQGHGLHTLLRHCEVQVQHCRRMLEEAKDRENERHMKSAQQSINKWQAWADAVRACLESPAR